MAATPTFALATFNQVLKDHGWPAIIIVVMLGLFLGWLHSPISDSAEYAKENNRILNARQQAFEHIIITEMTHCVATAKDDTDRQACIKAAQETCDSLPKVK